MIFLDETGKRWKAVKRVTLTSSLAVMVPVVALVAGAYILNPGWSALQLRPFIESKPSGNTASTPGSANVLGATIGSHRLAVLTPRTTSGTAASATSQNGASAATTPVTPAPAPTPTPTPASAGSKSTPTPTANAKTTQPGNSSSGLSHHFTTL